MRRGEKKISKKCSCLCFSLNYYKYNGRKQKIKKNKNEDFIYLLSLIFFGEDTLLVDICSSAGSGEDRFFEMSVTVD